MTRIRNRRGFTLVEVLLVLVILVILAGFAMTAIGPMRNRANVDAARTQIGGFENALKAYQVHMGDFPPTGDGLQALRVPPNSAGDGWSGPYIDKEIPLDPWQMQYQYEYPGKRNGDEKPDIWSLGRDRMDGTQDDVGNW